MNKSKTNKSERRNQTISVAVTPSTKERLKTHCARKKISMATAIIRMIDNETADLPKKLSRFEKFLGVKR